LGYELDELLGKKFFDYVHKDDIDITLDAMQQLKANEEILNFVNRYRCKDGTYKWIEWRSKLIGTSIYAVARDITEAKLAKDEMIKSIELFKQIFDSSPAATVLSEIETGKYIDVNNSFERILGYTKEETIGKTSKN
jgi:PAS domain-containing protein